MLNAQTKAQCTERQEGEDNQEGSLSSQCFTLTVGYSVSTVVYGVPCSVYGEHSLDKTEATCPLESGMNTHRRVRCTPPYGTMSFLME
jgi:hypothetical protein